MAPIQSPASDIQGVILAGGQAQRLGGEDKGLIELAGQPLIAHAIRHFAPQVDNRLMLSANRNLTQYRQWGYPVLTDDRGDYEGPLAGLLRAMQQTSTKYLATLPCDAPRPPEDLVSRLWQAIAAAPAQAAIAHDGQRAQPLFGLFHTSQQAGLAKFIDSGQRKVQHWVDSLAPVYVDFSDCPEAFSNINTREDLEIITQQMGRQKTP